MSNDGKDDKKSSLRGQTDSVAHVDESLLQNETVSDTQTDKGSHERKTVGDIRADKITSGRAIDVDDGVETNIKLGSEAEVEPVFSDDIKWFEGDYPLVNSDSLENLSEGVSFGFEATDVYDKQYSEVEVSELDKDADLRKRSSAAFCATSRDGVLSKAPFRKGSEFRQDNINPLGGVVGQGLERVLSPVKEGEAVDYGARFSQSRGRGAYYTIPIKEHGFYVQLRPVKAMELAALVEEIQSDGVALGRDSFGLLGSSMTTATRDKVSEFAIRHITRTNIKGFKLSVANLRAILDQNGLNELINGLMKSTHSDGIIYTRQCINNKPKCRNSRKGVLKIDKLKITDQNAFSPEAFEMIFGEGKKGVTLDEVKNYRNLIKLPKSKSYDLGSPKVRVTIATPTLEKMSRIGEKWVKYVMQKGTEASPAGETKGEKDERIKRFANVCKAVQQEAFVVSIEDISGNAGIARTEDDIFSVLKEMSSDSNFVKELKDSVADFNDISVISAFGVNEFKCDKCKCPQVEPGHEGFISLDMVSCFLLLCFRGWEKMTES